MRRAISVAGLVLAFALAPFVARAQTATFAADCNSGISVTNGGLTLQLNPTAADNTYWCIANFPKYSGRWYFEFTVNALSATANVPTSIGIGNNGPAQPVTGGLAATGAQATRNASYLTTTSNAGTRLYGYPYIQYPSPLAVGQTGAVAVDLDTDTPQMWVTTDVTGTDGYSGGPMWNGSATSSPLVAGSGTPTTGGSGLKFWLAGQAYFPIFGGATYQNRAAGGVTFNFGAGAFAGTPPTGYKAWNTVGGDAPTPGPTHPATVNVANAPAWQASTAYVQGDRVLAGPAWNGSAYTSGQSLYLWALTGGYGGTSGTSATTFNSCPSSSNYGGGLLGNTPTQWRGATHVKDGQLTWTCLTPVDFTTFTAMEAYDPVTWAPNTSFGRGAYVMSGGSTYEEAAGGVTFCTSASGPAPSGTGFGITDGTCSWSFVGTVPYFSGVNRVPHEKPLMNGTTIVWETTFDWNIAVNLWYGGKAAPRYQDGANGETDPMMLANHQDFSDARPLNCMQGTFAGAVYNGGTQPPINCNGLNVPWFITLQAAPGDSFAANMTPGVTPFGYPNSAYGVEIYSDSPDRNAAPLTGPALTLSDSYLNIFGLQLYSASDIALPGFGIGATTARVPGSNSSNQLYLDDSILYAGGGYGVMSTDADTLIANSTLVYAGSNSGCFAVMSKFNAALVNDTLIGPGTNVANCSAITTLNGSAIGITTVPLYNNASFGWANTWAYSGASGASPALPTAVGGGNATDLPSSYVAGGTYTIGDSNKIYQPAMLPGVSAYGLTAAAQFVNPSLGPGMDLRLLPSGSLYGGGVSVNTPFGIGLNQVLATGPDIFGNGRPQGTRYDIGAYQYAIGCASPSGVGCQ